MLLFSTNGGSGLGGRSGLGSAASLRGPVFLGPLSRVQGYDGFTFRVRSSGSSSSASGAGCSVIVGGGGGGLRCGRLIGAMVPRLPD